MIVTVYQNTIKTKINKQQVEVVIRHSDRDVVENIGEYVRGLRDDGAGSSSEVTWEEFEAFVDKKEELEE